MADVVIPVTITTVPAIRYLYSPNILRVIALAPSVNLTVYHMRGNDSAAGFVYWIATGSVNLTPASNATIPPLIGTLSKICIIHSRVITSNL